MDSNFKIMYLMVVMTMLCLNIIHIGIITVTNVDYCCIWCIIHNISKSQAISLLKNYVLKDRGYIQKKYCLKISVLSKQLVLLFLFSIYKTVYIIDTYKSLTISIGTVIKNPEMLKFVPDNLKTKQCVSTQLSIYLIY